MRELTGEGVGDYEERDNWLKLAELVDPMLTRWAIIYAVDGWLILSTSDGRHNDLEWLETLDECEQALLDSGGFARPVIRSLIRKARLNQSQ